ALGLTVLAWPSRGALLFVLVWKLASEAFRPLAGEPIWEFVGARRQLRGAACARVAPRLTRNAHRRCSRERVIVRSSHCGQRIGEGGEAQKWSPLAFPAGLARLATMPAPAGSNLDAMTIGIVCVARVAASAARVSIRHDHLDPELNELDRQIGEPFSAAVGRAVL